MTAAYSYTRGHRPSGDLVLGRALASVRKIRRVTQSEAARRSTEKDIVGGRLSWQAGTFSRVQLAQWENAHRAIPVACLAALERIYNVQFSGTRQTRSLHHMGAVMRAELWCAVTCRSTGNVLWSVG